MEINSVNLQYMTSIIHRLSLVLKLLFSVFHPQLLCLFLFLHLCFKFSLPNLSLFVSLYLLHSLCCLPLLLQLQLIHQQHHDWILIIHISSPWWLITTLQMEKEERRAFGDENIKRVRTHRYTEREAGMYHPNKSFLFPFTNLHFKVWYYAPHTHIHT